MGLEWMRRSPEPRSIARVVGSTPVLSFLAALCTSSHGTAQSIRLNGPLAQPIGGDVTSFLATPDGERVVYRADQADDDVFELFSAPADRSSAPVRLNQPLASDADVVDFAISSGGRVAFRTQGVDGLFSVPADGSASPVQLDDGVTVEAFWLGADGTFAVYRFDHQLYRVPVDGSAAPVPVAPGHDLASAVLSPDGEWAVFEVRSSAGGLLHDVLYSVPTDASALPVVIGSSGNWSAFVDQSSIEDLKFSPDSQFVLYQDVVLFDGDHGTALTSARLDGTATRRLEEDHTGNASFLTAISPQGRVVYSVDLELFSVEPDGTQLVQLDPTSWFVHDLFFNVRDRVQISADGASVVFQAHDAPPPGGNRALLAAPIDGSQPAVVLASPGQPVPFQEEFQAQSSTVVYGASGGMHAVPIAGGAPPLLIGTAPKEFVFHPDEERVVFRAASAGDVNQLYVVPVDGSLSPRRLNGSLTAGGDVLSFLITSDGGRAIYRADELQDEVFELFGALVDGGDPNVRYNPPLGPGPVVGDVLGFQDLAGSQRVVYRADQDDDEVVDLYSTRKDGHGEPLRLTQSLAVADGDVLADLVVSPTEERVVFQHATPSQKRLLSVRANPPDAPVVLDSSTLAFPFPFAVTADGARVVYCRPSPSKDLVSRAIDGSAPVVTLADLAINRAVDEFQLGAGDTVVYRADQTTDEVLELFAVPADGSAAPIQLSQALVTGGDVTAFRIAGDGSRVVFRADATLDERADLFSVPGDGSAPPVLLCGALVAGGDVAEFILTAAGARVVYRADQVVDEQFELFSAPADGSAAAVRLTVLPAGRRVEPDFAVSLDGLLVLYRADAASASVIELYVVESDGSSGPVRLSAPLVAGGDVSSFALSSDLSHVVYRADQRTDEVFELFSRALGAPAFALDSMPAFGDVGAYRIDPDLEHVVYLADRDADERVELFRARLDGSAPPERLNPPLVASGDVQPDFVALPGGGVLYRADRESDEVFELFHFLDLDLEHPHLPASAPTGTRTLLR